MAFDYQQIVFGAAWNLRRGDRNLGGLRLDRALKALEVRADIRTGAILEAGCGVGRFTANLSAHLPDARVVAFDLSRAAVVEAGHREPHVGYAVADAQVLPYADSTFDAVVFFDLLEHLEHPGTALKEFARVLQPGGLLHGYVPCEGQPPTLHWLLGGWVHGLTRRHAGHTQHYRHADLMALVQRAGFAVFDQSYSYHLLGQTLDVATFVAREVIFQRCKGERRHPEAFYDRSVLGDNWLSRLYGATRQAIESVAYIEARLLSRCSWALGVHLTARRISDKPGAQTSPGASNA